MTRSAPLLVFRVLAAAMAAGCAHPEPFGAAAIPDNPPRAPGLRGLQLTWLTAKDQAPSWLPDGSLAGFSWALPGRADGDKCLAFLSLSSGRVSREICRGAADSDDTASALRSHAVSAGGRLAFVAETGRRGAPPSQRTLYVGRYDHPGASVPVLSFPLTSSSGLLHVSAEQLAWAGESTLVFLATAIENGMAQRSAGLEIATLDLSASTAVLRVVPNSQGATSVAVDPVTGALYGTFAGDARLYALNGTTGARQAAVDFSAFGTPRDARVVNGRAVAVVQGRVYPVVFGTLTQFDEGGEVAVGVVGGAAPVLLVPLSTHWFRHLAMSPAGDRILAEAYALDIHSCCPALAYPPLDTVVAPVSDLWLIAIP